MGIDIIIKSIIYMATLLLGVLLIFSMFKCMTIKLSKHFPIKLDNELLVLKASPEQKKDDTLLGTVFEDFWKKHKGYFIYFAFIIFWTSLGALIDCKSGCSHTCYPDVMTMGQKLSVIKKDLNYFVSNSNFFFFLFFFVILKIIGINSFNGRNTIGLGLTETFVVIFFYSVLGLSCGCYCNINTLSLTLFSLSLYLFLVIMTLTMVLWIFIKSITYLKPISYRLGIQDPLDFIILIFATFPFIWIVYDIISIL